MNKLKYTTYLACAIENATLHEASNWKVGFKDSFNPNDLGIYDPITFEAAKTGKPSKEMCNYISGLKRGGHWQQFHEAMHQIWWANVKTGVDRVEVLRTFRNRALVDGNKQEDLYNFGDYEAVLRSDFVIAYLEKNVKTVGTICEIHTAYLFNIPVYLILPDQTKTEANSTLIDIVIKSGGDIFYSVKDAIKFIKEKYNLE